MTPTGWLLLVALAFVAAAAAWDLRTGHIPNALTYGGLACGAVLHLSVRVLTEPPVTSPFRAAPLGIALGYLLLGVVLCAAAPSFLFVRHAMGGGDVKLLAAVGAFLGPVLGLEVQLYSFLVLVLVAPARLAYEGRLLQVLRDSAALLFNPLVPKAQRRAIDPEALSSHRFAPAVLAALAVVVMLRWSAT
ncbi:MAG: A24 family peptidase [Polyangiales bacterium]